MADSPNNAEVERKDSLRIVIDEKFVESLKDEVSIPNDEALKRFIEDSVQTYIKLSGYVRAGSHLLLKFITNDGKEQLVRVRLPFDQ